MNILHNAHQITHTAVGSAKKHPTAFGLFRNLNKPKTWPGILGGAIKSGYDAGYKGQLMFNLPIAAFSAAMAPRGSKVSTAAGALVGSPITALATFWGGPLVGMAAGFLWDNTVGTAISGGLQKFKDYDSAHRRLNQGGTFMDSEAAFTQRQAAAQEMSRSLFNARQYLGSESVLFHS